MTLSPAKGCSLVVRRALRGFGIVVRGLTRSVLQSAGCYQVALDSYITEMFGAPHKNKTQSPNTNSKHSMLLDLVVIMFVVFIYLYAHCKMAIGII